MVFNFIKGCIWQKQIFLLHFGMTYVRLVHTANLLWPAIDSCISAEKWDIFYLCMDAIHYKFAATCDMSKRDLSWYCLLYYVKDKLKQIFLVYSKVLNFQTSQITQCKIFSIFLQLDSINFYYYYYFLQLQIYFFTYFLLFIFNDQILKRMWYWLHYLMVNRSIHTGAFYTKR